MKKYRLMKRKGEGTFSEVLSAQNIKSGEMVAIKCMKQTFNSIEQVNGLREIQALRRLSPHPNVVTLHEVLYDKPTGRYVSLLLRMPVIGVSFVVRDSEHLMAYTYVTCN